MDILKHMDEQKIITFGDPDPKQATQEKTRTILREGGMIPHAMYILDKRRSTGNRKYFLLFREDEWTPCNWYLNSDTLNIIEGSQTKQFGHHFTISLYKF